MGRPPFLLSRFIPPSQLEVRGHGRRAIMGEKIMSSLTVMLSCRGIGPAFSALVH